MKSQPKQAKQPKYKAPGTLKELNLQSNLRELSDYLIDPKNKVIKAVIICYDTKEEVSINTTEDLKLTESLGLIEFAKYVLLCDNDKEFEND